MTVLTRRRKTWLDGKITRGTAGGTHAEIGIRERTRKDDVGLQMQEKGTARRDYRHVYNGAAIRPVMKSGAWKYTVSLNNVSVRVGDRSCMELCIQ